MNTDVPDSPVYAPHVSPSPATNEPNSEPPTSSLASLNISTPDTGVLLVPSVFTHMVTRGGVYEDWLYTFFGPCLHITEDVLLQLLTHLDLHTVTEVLSLEHTSPSQFVARIPASLMGYTRHFAAIYAYTRHSLHKGADVVTPFVDFLTNTTKTYGHVYNALRAKVPITPPPPYTPTLAMTHEHITETPVTPFPDTPSAYVTVPPQIATNPPGFVLGMEGSRGSSVQSRTSVMSHHMEPYSHSEPGQPHIEGAPPVTPEDVDSYNRGQAKADAIDFDRYADEFLAH